jgi:3-oxoacyl-[acyl-carrier protein] reductase
MGGTGGSIINIGSVVSSYGNVGQINYAASKGGVAGLTKALAKEMALLSWQTATATITGGVNAGRERDKDNDDIIVETCIPPTIRVNCIQPGFINTPMVDAVSKKVIAEMTNKIALRRLGRVEDVANLVLFLASNDRSGYITGECFECSGMLRI